MRPRCRSEATRRSGTEYQRPTPKSLPANRTPAPQGIQRHNFASYRIGLSYGQHNLDIPSNPNAPLPSGLSIGNAANVYDIYAGYNNAGANVTANTDIEAYFGNNFFEGSQNWALGAPQDNGQGSDTWPFWGVGRHYLAEDPYNTNVVGPDGMYLLSYCQRPDGTHTQCAPGSVWGGIIHPMGAAANFRPGQLIDIYAKMPTAPDGWFPLWFFSGSGFSPGPGNASLVGSNGSPFVSMPVSGQLAELDINDNFLDVGQSETVGFFDNFGMPSVFAGASIAPIHGCVTGDGFKCQWLNNSPPSAREYTPIDCSHNFCHYQVWWEGVDNGAPEIQTTVHWYLNGFEFGRVDLTDNAPIQNGVRQGLALYINHQWCNAYEDDTNNVEVSIAATMRTTVLWPIRPTGIRVVVALSFRELRFGTPVA